jgi:hypothetical protein
VYRLSPFVDVNLRGEISHNDRERLGQRKFISAPIPVFIWVSVAPGGVDTIMDSRHVGNVHSSAAVRHRPGLYVGGRFLTSQLAAASHTYLPA